MGALAATCSHPRGTEGQRIVSEATASPTPALPAAALAATGQASIADIAQRAVPSVVNISATKVVKTNGARHPLFHDPFFREFFGHRNPAPSQRRQRSLGSGVIVSADGVVLTNNHVVEHARDIRVTLSDGRDLTAKVVGADPKSDLAVLRISGKPKNLTPISFGASAKLRLGDVVLAIGNPFGVGQTVTMGIVSAKGRTRVGIVDYEDFIQTDAAINPGNSGGALINMRGELIGINTAILSRSGGYQGIGFAIPTDMAKPIMQSLLRHGKVERGWLGVSIQDVTPDLAQAMSLSVTKGVLIAGVTPNSPAHKAGLKRGDVVQTVNGQSVPDTNALRNRIAALGPKARATLGVLRKGQSKTLVATLGSLSRATTASADANLADGLLAGVQVANLSAKNRREHGIENAVLSGVVITSLDPSSSAAGAGLRVGDVLMELNRKPIRSVADFQKLYKPSATSIVLLVRRAGTTMFVALRK